MTVTTPQPRTRLPRLPDDLLTYEEAADLLRRSPKTIYRMVARGDLEAITVSGRRFILRTSVNALVRRLVTEA